MTGSRRMLLLLSVAALAAGPVKPATTSKEEVSPLWERSFARHREGPYMVGDIALDSKNNLWMVVVDPPSLLRLGAKGETVETVPLPEAVAKGITNSLERALAVMHDGTFVVNHWRFRASGEVLGKLPFQYANDLEVGLDGTLWSVYNDGLWHLDAAGNVLTRVGGEGVGPGKFMWAGGLAILDGKVAVSDRGRIQIFDAAGALVRTLGQDGTSTITSTHARFWDLAAHGELLYGADPGAGGIAVIRPGSGVIAHLAPGFDKVVVDVKGAIYASSWTSASARAYAPLPDAIVKAAPPAPAPAASADVRLTSLDVHWVPLPTANFEVHAGTRDVRRIVRDPRDVSILWLATEGGLVRYDTKREKWTIHARLDPRTGGNVNDLFIPASGPFRLAAWWGPARFDPGTGKVDVLNGVTTVLVLHDVVPASDGAIWYVDAGGLLREAPDGTFSELRLVGVKEAVPLGKELILRSDERIYRWDPGAEAPPRSVVTMDDLSDLAGGQSKSRGVRIEALGVDAARKKAFLGTMMDGTFVLDLVTSKLEPLPQNAAIKTDCRAAVITSVGGHTYVAGTGCFGEITADGAWQPVALEQNVRFSDVVADATGDRVWVATSEGLRSYDPRHRALVAHAPPGELPYGHFVATLGAIRGKLFAGFGGSGISVLDPTSHTWSTPPKLLGLDRIREVASGDSLVAFGWHQQRGVWLVDPKSLDARPLVLGSEIETVEDVEYDGESYWLVGVNFERKGLWRVDRSGKATFIDDPSFRVGTAVLQDPKQPGQLLIASSEGLVRFDKKTLHGTVVGPRCKTFRYFGGDTLWLTGEGTHAFDLVTGATRVVQGKDVAYDGAHIFALGYFGSDGADVLDVTTLRRVGRLDLEPKVQVESIAVVGGKIWFGSYQGILEAAVPPTARERP